MGVSINALSGIAEQKGITNRVKFSYNANNRSIFSDALLEDAGFDELTELS